MVGNREKRYDEILLLEGSPADAALAKKKIRGADLLSHLPGGETDIVLCVLRQFDGDIVPSGEPLPEVDARVAPGARSCMYFYYAFYS